jgi:hypothetical protein
MNKEKQDLVNLLKRIDQTKKELKKLMSEYEKVFTAICKSWQEQTASAFPDLQPCGIGEYVGVDVVYEGKTYNVFISEYNQKLYCMFSLDRKDKSTYSLSLKDEETALFEKLNNLFTDDSDKKSSVRYTGVGLFKVFKKDNYEEAFDFYLKVVESFTVH